MVGREKTGRTYILAKSRKNTKVQREANNGTKDRLNHKERGWGGAEKRGKNNK